ncbi:MAG: hypothetical protein IPM52_03435 [Bacteroidetes bacterium]|nr:hypothetical protein [Bacteroidota bacterium]
MGVNRKYRIKMEVITPLHVGAASEKHYQQGIDYFYDERGRQVIFINQQKAAAKFLDRYTTYLLNADENQIKNLVQQNPELVLRRVPVTRKPGGSIKAHVRNGLTGKPIVPGSSIKGALRSVLFKHLRGQEITNEEVFGRLNDNNDFMRFIRVGDVQFNNTSLINAKIFNLRTEGGQWVGGWKHALHHNTTRNFSPNGFVTTYETIRIKEPSTFDLMISDTLFDLFYRQQNARRPARYESQNQLIHADIRHLFNIINGHTRSFLMAEKRFFDHYNQADRIDGIIENIDYLLDFLQEKDSCLFRLASGSGFHAITGDWQRPDHTSTVINQLNGRRYKSRRISFYDTEDGLVMLPMGYVLLTYLPD